MNLLRPRREEGTLFSGGYRYFELEREWKDRSFGNVVSGHVCMDTIVADREGNITMPLKRKYRQLELRVQWIKDRMSAGQVSISECLNAIGHLIRFSYNKY